MIFKLPLKFQLKTNVNLLSPTWTLSVSRIPITYGFWSAISCKVTEKKLHCYEIYFMLTYRKYQKMHLLITCDCICHNFCTIFLYHSLFTFISSQKAYKLHVMFIFWEFLFCIFIVVRVCFKCFYHMSMLWIKKRSMGLKSSLYYSTAIHLIQKYQIHSKLTSRFH